MNITITQDIEGIALAVSMVSTCSKERFFAMPRKDQIKLATILKGQGISAGMDIIPSLKPLYEDNSVEAE